MIIKIATTARGGLQMFWLKNIITRKKQLFLFI